MILLDKKKPISALRLIHTLNHTQTNKLCDINNDHINLIPTLDYTIGKHIYNLHAGLYKVIINEIEYIIDVYYDLRNGDFLVIKNENSIIMYMAGSEPYNIIPYRINSTKDIISACNIKSINDSIDIIMVAGNTNYTGFPSLESPISIDRISALNINTKSKTNTDSLSIPLKHTLGKLPNGARDMVIINTDKMVIHDVINTSREILSGGLNCQYKEEYSNSDYYVFFIEYKNVKLNNTAGSIRCSHFESGSCDSLLNESTKNNCIATSYGSYGNGIWIKIAASVLDIHGDKNFNDEMKKWILTQAVSDNPIYIEYEITNTIYNTILIDEYHIKTWHPNTTITIYGDYGFSVFYKSL